MKRAIVPVVVACLFLPAGVLFAQQPVTINLKTRGAGDSVVVAKDENMSMTMKIIDASGKVLADKNIGASSQTEYVETILKRAGKKLPTALERQYLKSVSKQGDKTNALPLQGKKVVIEKKNGSYTFTYKGGEAIAGEAAAALTKEFSRLSDERPEMEKLILPKTAVKPGDTWKLDMGPIVKDMAESGSLDADLAKVTGTGKLQKVYMKDGKQFGVMTFKLDVPVKSMGQPGAKMQFANAAKGIVDVALDACIDGTSEIGTMKTRMTISGTATMALLPPGATVTLNLMVDSATTQREPAKK